MDENKFCEIMAMIKGAYGAKFQELTTDVMDTWYNCLSDLDGDRLKTAAGRYIKEHQYPPTIADLREACYKIPIVKPVDISLSDNFDVRFQNLTQDQKTEFLKLGIITKDAGINLYDAEPEHIRILKESGAL